MPAAFDIVVRRYPTHQGHTGRALRLLLVVAWLSWLSRTAEAQGEPVPTRVELRAPSGCPTADTFLAELHARTPVRAAAADEPAVTLLIEIEPQANQLIGRLGSSSTAGIESRRIEGKTCSEVMSALALSAALALEDGQWELTTPAPVVADAPTEPAPVETAPPTAPPAPERPALPLSYHWSLGAGASANALALPLLWGPTLAFGHRASDALFLTRARLSYGIELPDVSTSADLTLLTLSADVCPKGFELGHGFRVWPCASVQGGALRGRGQALTKTKSATLPYAAAGVGTGLEWTLGRVRLELFGVGLLTLARPRFTAEKPARTLERTGAFALSWGFLGSYAF